MTRRAWALGVCILALSAASASATPGEPDRTFGDGGRFTYDFEGGSSGAVDAAVQADGKILLAGNGAGGFTVIRLRADGTLDRGFGHRGVATADFGHPKISCQLDYPCGSRGFDDLSAIALQPDGRIVLGGTAYVKGSDFDFAAARLNPNGALDRSFSRNGKVTIDAGEEYDRGEDMVLEPDGQIVLGGRQGDENTSSSIPAVVRLTSSGRPDPSFGDGGVALTTFGTNDDWIFGIAVQPDGKIVGVGNAYRGQYRGAVARLNADGSPDLSFSGDGHEVIRVGRGGGNFLGVAIQKSGAIVLGGYAGKYIGVARLLPDGSLDPTFGEGGQAQLAFAIEGSHQFFGASDVLIEPDDSILIGANANSELAPPKFFQDVGVIHLNPSGTYDSSFGDGGRQLAGLRTDTGQGVGLALQPDGAVVLATSTCAQKQRFCNRYEFAAVRFRGD